MRDLSEIFKAYDIRGLVGDQLDEDLARAVGLAAANVIMDDAEAMVIGHDMRPSSPGLAEAFADGVKQAGRDVIHIGLASTDQLYYASGALNAPGAMFTASHNPAEYNGIKLCRKRAAPVGQDTGLAEIQALVENPPPPAKRQGTVHQRDVLTDYADYLNSLVDLSGSRPLTVVVDAGNGMAGHTVPAVLNRPELTIIPMYFELDGTFPNHEANPIDPANLVDLRSAVREHNADLGLAFDGDADRCFIVDENSEVVSPSTLTSLIAVAELERHPGALVVHNLITSRAVPEVITENGGKPVRTRVGHSFIKQTMAETGAVFGGEHSGHFYFQNFWRADSGMLAALHALAAVGHDSKGRQLSELLAPYERYVSSGEINTRVEDREAILRAIEEEYGRDQSVEIDKLDGLTVTHTGEPLWWFNVRPSNTESLIRLNVEGADQTTMQRARDAALRIIRPGDAG